MEVLTERLVPNIILLILVLSFTTVTHGQDICLIAQPCQNGGTCVSNSSAYTCNCFGEFTGPNCSSLTFEASLGISDIIKHNLLPFILGISPPDMTNFNALKLLSLVTMDPDVQVSNPPKTFKWTLNGSRLDLSSNRFKISPSGQLTISSGSLNDEGEYQFFVSNEYGAMFSNRVSLKFSVTGSFISPATPINVSMTENEPFRLSCPPRVNSYRVYYDWTARQQSIAMNPSYAPRILMEPNGDLLFSYVDRSDFTTFIASSGELSWTPIKCSTTDLFGVSALGPDVFFYVTSPASQSQSSLKFYTKPSGVYTVATGDQLYLNCTAGGRPTPDIFWYKNNILITDAGDSFQHELFNRTLRLGSLSPSVHDGSYKCVAVSGLLKVESSFTVKVIDRIFPLYSREHANYDFIEIKSGKHGESVTLPCNTSGGEIKIRTWYYNGVKLQSSSKFANRWSAEPSTGALTLSSLQLEDFGLFQCLVENKVSEHYVVSLLVVTGAPLPPFAVNTTSCANFSTTLSWDVSLRRDLLPPVGFIIDVAYKQVASSLPTSSYSKLAEISSGSARSYVVKNLQPYSQFYFRIRAKNQVGVGLPALLPTQVTCVTNSARPSLYPKKLAGSPFFLDGWLNVSWKALDPLDWNAASSSCVYRLFYRTANTSWLNTTTRDCASTSHLLRGLTPNTLYEIAIRTENSEGSGPTSPAIVALSGQRPPPEPPAELNVLRVNSSSFEVEWAPLFVSPPRTVDGYWIYAWTGRILRTFQFEEIPRVFIPINAIRVQVAVRGVSRGVVAGLQPWTEYNVAVEGYNNIGPGPTSDEILSVTTLDSKDSYYILLLRIVNEIFTDGLKDQSTSEFKALQAKLKREISILYGKQPWYKNCEVLSFRNGSVQAEIQLETASPNMSVVLQVVSSMNNLGNFSLDRNVTAIRSEPAIQGVTVNASRLLLKVGGKFAISCTVIGGPDDLKITWFKAGKEIGLSHRTKVDTQVRRSRLSVRDVMAEDEGAYICGANKGNQNSTASIFIGVVPVLQIKPRSVTKRVGDEVTFTCDVVSGFRKGAGVFVVEVTNKGNEVHHQELNYTTTNLQIPGGGESHVRKFVCEMSFQQDVLSRSEVAELIIIKPEAPKCPEELVDGVLWSPTAAGGTDVKPCPNGASGAVSRDCSAEVTWKDTSFVGCSSPEFIRLGDEIEAITEGFQSNTTAQQVLSQLVNFTQPVENNTQRPPEIFGGDLVIAVEILVTLADFNTKQGNVSTEEDVENFAQVSSNLLEPTNRITWQELDQIVQGQSRRLVKAIDNYGLGVAATYNGSTVSKVVQTKNLVMRIDRALEGSLLRVEGLIVTDNQSSIRLPAEAFGTSQDSRVITVVYLTLNDVLTLNEENDKDSDLAPPANTTIVSSTIDPRPPVVLNNPVKIVLQNRKVNVPAGVTPEGLCVYWRPGESLIWETSGCSLVASESDINKTTCECDHLTTFASLMDPYGSTIGEADQKALEIISIVGCSISLLAVIMTIAVTLFFWRAVKSPRSKVLLNLCAAVAVSCILVISEGSARDNEVGCTVVAALLHYFLLALFCWMLCEGVLLYILLVKVFGGGADDKVKYFYLLGWGFPVIIVAVSLGATQADGYGSSEGCWLDVPSGLVWAFIAPAILIILINIVVFILVIRQMMGTRHVQNKTQIEKVKAGVKASAVILPLLGITWLFGLLSFSSSTVAFKYLFAITNSLQGLMIFIFHCLLNKQIQDAIKRIREKSSSGGASTIPKTKPSPIQNPKHATNLPAPGNKKRSNRAQNDYEMMDSITSAKSDTLPSGHDNKDAIIHIPDEQNITKQLPVAKALTHEQPEKQHNLPPFERGNELLPMDNGPEEEGADEKTPRNSFIPHETQDNGLKRVESPEGSDREDELECDRKVSVNGVANHIYEKPPDDYVPSFEEFQKSNRAGPRFEDEDVHAQVKSAVERTPENDPSGSRRGGVLLHDDKGSVDGVTNSIYQNTSDKYDPFVEIKGKDARRSSSSSSSSSSVSEVLSVELSREINPVINQEDIGCVLEEAAPLEGALPLDLDDKPFRLTSKKVEPRDYDDSVKNDEDFDEKMAERRTKVDSVQRAADGFKSHQKLSVQTSSSRSLWQQVRQKIIRESYKVAKSRGSPDESENRNDVCDNVEDTELM